MCCVAALLAALLPSHLSAADSPTAAPARAAQPPSLPAADAMTLRQVVQRVLDYNETIQIRALEWLSSQKRAKAARGIFEPEFVGSAEMQRNERRNSVQQQLGLFGSEAFSERNNIYSGAIETLLSTGGKLRVGYSLRDLSNNLQARYGTGINEYESFMGASLVQPLLKNGGPNVTMAAIRLAAGESELAFQEYRRQTMLMVARAETAYWDLFFAQELAGIRADSVRIARTLLDDNKARAQVGKSSELEVLEAQAGVAFRQARLEDALQKLIEARNRLAALVSGAAAFTNTAIAAADHPQLREIETDFFRSMEEAFEWNPDYLTQRRQVIQENIRLAYAKNQRYPQLDLKASYGLSGLADSPGASWDDIRTSDYENWSVGVEMRIPLGGGQKVKNEYEAVKLRKQQALLSLKSVEVEISSALDTSIRRVGSTRDGVQNYQEVVEFNKRVLDTELVSVDTGKSDSRRVLEAEGRLSEARSSVLESQVNYEKSLLEWDLIRGTVLRTRNLEITREELGRKTGTLGAGGQWTAHEYQLLMKDTGAAYDRKAREALIQNQNELVDHLRRTLSELPPPDAKPPATPPTP